MCQQWIGLITSQTQARITTKMDISSLFQQLRIAPGLKTPVGSQRDSAASHLAGVRSFPPVTILRTVCGLALPASVVERIDAELFGFVRDDPRSSASSAFY